MSAYLDTKATNSFTRPVSATWSPQASPWPIYATWSFPAIDSWKRLDRINVRTDERSPTTRLTLMSCAWRPSLAFFVKNGIVCHVDGPPCRSATGVLHSWWL